MIKKIEIKVLNSQIETYNGLAMHHENQKNKALSKVSEMQSRITKLELDGGCDMDFYDIRRGKCKHASTYTGGSETRVDCENPNCEWVK